MLEDKKKYFVVENTKDESLVLSYLFDADPKIKNNFKYVKLDDYVFKIEYISENHEYDINRLKGYLYHVFDTMNDTFLEMVRSKSFTLKKKDDN